ncbi:MAG TPA: 50S ribosomal protein L15 [Kiritimatiellae bacterium]|nr:50S ribosomal protein L15 [Kiritimatiellia bacterium]
MRLERLAGGAGSRKRSKRVGCGRASGRGKTCGRGTKGYKARSGSRRKVGFEGGQMPLVRRLPKRGFRHVRKHAFAVLNLRDLAAFVEGEVVSPETLKEKGLIKGRYDGVKILGNGELRHALLVKAHSFSDPARAKIEAAGGRCELLPR